MPDSLFTKENLDLYLRELAKEYRKLVGKAMPAEIILVGGAAVLAGYGFRNSTYDMDAIIEAASAMKDAVNRVGNRYELPVGWINDDFIRTKSFSNRLAEISINYKTFSNVLTIRLVSAEYLIAMKLMSARSYKNDYSDIIGILWEHQKAENPISLAQIQKAVTDLYGNWAHLSENARTFICAAEKETDYASLFEKTRESEQQSGILLKSFDQTYPQVLNEANLDDILKVIQQKKKSDT